MCLVIDLFRFLYFFSNIPFGKLGLGLGCFCVCAGLHRVLRGLTLAAGSEGYIARPTLAVLPGSACLIRSIVHTSIYHRDY